MSWTLSSTNSTIAGEADAVSPSRTRAPASDNRSHQVLPMPTNTRASLTDFYRQRDEEDARLYASGDRKMRGLVYALGLARLERGEEVFESYRVLRAAGVDLPPRVVTILEGLPQDRRQVCRIAVDGTVWTASLRERRRAGR